MLRTGTCGIQTRPRPDVPADAVLYAVVVYGPDQQPVEVLLPFHSVAAADHHAKSRGLDGRVVPITFPFHTPRPGS
ncbi:hypothetical protein BL254_17255 [Protofrankia sp. BMG5.30]|uniref:Uncharacterized protein n=1 Tax=Protofrankia coriariae TaxID=1562887 RepID=A0ABR5F598_9ACTN|nr:hypothetical protein FrCorBMG51_08480 [Protofrankia coriariae]ONH34267.1 hypothetical protein BL254_17255 [Protofrankia sp. BMG5.30]